MLIRLVLIVFVLIEDVLPPLLLRHARADRARGCTGPVSVSDLLIAPFQVVVTPFTLDQLSGLPGGDLGYARYLDQVDTTVLVAMIGWAVIGSVLLFLMGALRRVR